MDINWAIVKFVLIIGIVVIGPTLLVIWTMRSRARATRNPEIEAEYVLAGFEVETSRAHGGPVVKGTLQGTPFVLTASPGANTTPALTVITVPRVPGGSFVVSREGSRDLSGRDLLEPVFPDARARDAVRALFLLGFDTVSGRGANLSAIRSLKAGVQDLGSLRAAVEQLAVLRARPGTRAVATWAAPESGSVWIMGVTLTLLFAGFILFANANSATQPFADGAAAMMDVWPAVAAACLALVAIARYLLRDRPLVRGELAFIIFAALPGLCLGGMGAAMLANQHLDESAHRELHTQVAGREYHKRVPHVILAPWRAGGGSVAIEVSPGVHKNLKKGQHWIMRTRAGWLGYAWVESAQPVPNN
ncbi:MAG: hypothetical protein ACKVQK_13915 [Burkholderiales bacterium]